MKIVTVVAGALILAAPAAAFAANADHPYQDIDHSNDAGNNTGDSQTDRLNQAQLNSNGVPASEYRSAPSDGYASQPYGYAPQPQAYYAPQPRYMAPARPYYGGY